MIIPEIRYPIKLEAPNNKAYDEASEFIEYIANKKRITGKETFYFLKRGIVRTNTKKRTIELSDCVAPQINNLIKYLLESEKKSP